MKKAVMVTVLALAASMAFADSNSAYSLKMAKEISAILLDENF